MARKRENSTEKQTAFPPTKYVVKMAFFFFFCIDGYFKTCPGPKVGFIANMRWKKYICIYIHFGVCVFGSLEAAHTPNGRWKPTLLPLGLY